MPSSTITSAEAVPTTVVAECGPAIQVAEDLNQATSGEVAATATVNDPTDPLPVNMATGTASLVPHAGADAANSGREVARTRARRAQWQAGAAQVGTSAKHRAAARKAAAEASREAARAAAAARPAAVAARRSSSNAAAASRRTVPAAGGSSVGGSEEATA